MPLGKIGSKLRGLGVHFASDFPNTLSWPTIWSIRQADGHLQLQLPFPARIPSPWNSKECSLGRAAFLGCVCWANVLRPFAFCFFSGAALQLGPSGAPPPLQKAHESVSCHVLVQEIEALTNSRGCPCGLRGKEHHRAAGVPAKSITVLCW